MIHNFLAHDFRDTLPCYCAFFLCGVFCAVTRDAQIHRIATRKYAVNLCKYAVNLWHHFVRRNNNSGSACAPSESRFVKTTLLSLAVINAGVITIALKVLRTSSGG